MSNPEPVALRLYRASDASAWAAFLDQSKRGTLFHDMRFLAYHPDGRFQRHSLIFERGNRIVALLPGALHDVVGGGTFLVSPMGASVGGLVLADDLGTEEGLAVVAALQEYVLSRGWRGIEFRLPPSVYGDPPEELLPFCLLRRGFRAEKASLCYLLVLNPAQPAALVENFSKSKRYDLRTGLSRGLKPREVGEDLLHEFYELLQENSRKHQTTPTHDLMELRKLFELVPGKVRIFLCSHEGQELAGVLIFMLNSRVATSFYICEKSEQKRLAAPTVLLAHIAQKLAKEGFHYLDLGPSASEAHLNSGVVFFKESLGARGFLRPTWIWNSDAAQAGASERHPSSP